ncbi:hypothetical protein [Companilactobacillus ginsenosidimutans]|uniref:hypothetical protein n=1 Tax=Companilactobacillus ginsenosidimutans TaxID=1007676 RepID=UPI00066047E2|nr:hypothetical protein [Companilactobacillus ginsenosidimutans]
MRCRHRLRTTQAIQKNIKKELFDEFANGTGKATGAAFNNHLQKAWVNSQLHSRTEDVTSVALVNPIDFYDYIGSAPVTVQTVFGMTYIQNFLGVNTLIMSNNVPAGTIYVTASQNLNLYFATFERWITLTSIQLYNRSNRTRWNCSRT